MPHWLFTHLYFITNWFFLYLDIIYLSYYKYILSKKSCTLWIQIGGCRLGKGWWSIKKGERENKMGKRQRGVRSSGKPAETERKRTKPSLEGKTRGIKADVRWYLFFPASGVSVVIEIYFVGPVCKHWRTRPFFSAELLWIFFLCNLVSPGWQYSQASSVLKLPVFLNADFRCNRIIYLMVSPE